MNIKIMSIYILIEYLFVKIDHQQDFMMITIHIILTKQI